MWGLLISIFGKKFGNYLCERKFCVFCSTLEWKVLKVLLLMRRLENLFFAYCHYEGCRKCEKHYKKKKNICSTE